MKPSVFLIGVLLVLALAAGAGVRRVPPGSRAVIETRGFVRPATPGLHWITPGRDHLAIYWARAAMIFPAPEDTAGGSYRVFSAEGVPVETAIELRYELPPQGVTAFHRAAGGRAERALAPILKVAVRQVFAAHPAAELGPPGSREALARELSSTVAPRFKEIGVALLSLEITRLAPAAGSEGSLALAHAAARKRRVLVLGFDSADWTIIDRLRARGKLPAFDRMVREGASGPLRSIEPLLSPLIWTTIATGVGPDRHGILDFLVRDPRSGKMVPATSRYRCAPAIWNISSGYGKKTGVIGWLATGPAEAISGFVISDRFGFLAFAGETRSSEASDLVYPPDLLEGRERLIVASSSLGPRDIVRYLDVTAAEIEAARRPGYEKGNLVNNFIHTLATAETWNRLGLDLWKSERPDLELVYFEFLDATSHLFMSYAPPRRPEIDAGAYRKYSRAVDEAYVRQDEILAGFLREAGDSTFVVVVSDHGFRSGDARLTGHADMEDAEAAHWHLPDGVLILHGPAVKAGTRLSGARVFDVAPTVLALLGCPRTSDMTGRVLAQAFVPGTFSEEDSLAFATPRVVGFSPVSSGAATALAGESPGAAAAAGGRATEHINLGVVHARNRRPLEAESEFKKALEVDPGNIQAINNLASLYSQQNRSAEAIALLEKLLARDPKYAMGWSNLAVAQQKIGRTDAALESYGHALELEPNDQRSLTNRGFLLLEMRRPDQAEKDFRQALRISERQAKAHFGLGLALAGQGRRSEAMAELEGALEIDPGYVAARQALEELRQ